MRQQVKRHTLVTGAVLGALPLLLSTGCSFSIGGPGDVDAELVAERSSEMLAEAGQAPDEFTCTQDLPAEVGAEIRCNMVSGGMNYGVTITATSVNGTSVQWNIQVDDEAL
ncbi:hypothetical protein ADL05_24920 [Nocardiopsis sp. NRRL B-16309]|nr:hypothetical protein ADL05_24920 [Nocardiopsis sp. NRRL B-16309]